MRVSVFPQEAGSCWDVPLEITGWTEKLDWGQIWKFPTRDYRQKLREDLILGQVEMHRNILQSLGPNADSILNPDFITCKIKIKIKKDKDEFYYKFNYSYIYIYVVWQSCFEGVANLSVMSSESLGHFFPFATDTKLQYWMDSLFSESCTLMTQLLCFPKEISRTWKASFSSAHASQNL